jgi:hypothetical protein
MGRPPSLNLTGSHADVERSRYCLLNGIAVMEVNNFVRDGWESWGDIWNGPSVNSLIFSFLFFSSCRPSVSENKTLKKGATFPRNTPLFSTFPMFALSLSW